MTHQEILEMYKRHLERPDFTEEDKQATRINIRRLITEKMGEPVCAVDHCVEPPTHHLMKSIWICKTHERQGTIQASCAKCSCGAFVLLNSRTTMPEEHVYEFMCPVDVCRKVNRIGNDQTSSWHIPAIWRERGYFYARELSEL